MKPATTNNPGNSNAGCTLPYAQRHDRVDCADGLGDLHETAGQQEDQAHQHDVVVAHAGQQRLQRLQSATPGDVRR
jgi:hypothetical protein